MSAGVLAGGRVCRPMVSCHRDGTYSYHDGKTWIEKANEVPAAVLATLPAEEVARVNAHVHRRMGRR